MSCFLFSDITQNTGSGNCSFFSIIPFKGQSVFIINVLMFSLYHSSCITDYSHGCRTHVHSFCGLFCCFPQLFVSWQVYLSVTFLSFVCLRSISCSLVLHTFFIFCLFSSSWQSSESSAPQIQKVPGVFNKSDRVKIDSRSDSSLGSPSVLLPRAPGIFCFNLEKNWGRRGVEYFLHRSKSSCHKNIKGMIWIGAHRWWG